MNSSHENHAYENSEEILEFSNIATDLVPVTRYPSPYFEPFDSISVFSESTVPSEFAEIHIEDYEKRRKHRLEAGENLNNDSKQISNSNVQYNLRFDKIVIVGGNEKKDICIEDPVTQAVNEIITEKVNFDEIPLKYVAIDQNKFSKLIQRKIFFILVALFILLLIGGLSYLLSKILINKKEELTDLTTSSTTQMISTSDSTTQYENSTHSENILNYNIVKRDDWSSDEYYIPTTGKYKLIVPVNKIILLSTATIQCETKETCIEYMIEQQQNAYPDYDDIRENFIIALDGTIFEGRGFEREGESTCERDKITCYNSKAISISFIQKLNTDTVNKKQLSAFCQFIKDKQKIGSIDDLYNVFNHNNLISSTNINEYDNLCDCGHFYQNVPQIIRRNKAVASYDDDLRRSLSTKVVLRVTNVESCETKEQCSQVIDNFLEQNIDSSNFIFTENGLIFEDKNFDMAVNESLYDVLLISICGDYSTSQLSDSLITKLSNEFLKYSIALGKLPKNHKICITNKVQTLINVVQNLYPTQYDNFCNEQV